ATICPAWCAGEHAPGVEPVHQSTQVRHATAGRELLVTLDQTLDEDGALGAVYVTVAARFGARELWGELHPDHPLTLDQAAWLVEALSVALAQVRAAASLGGTNHYGRGVPVFECGRCGHEFHPDSSPSLTMCWQCAEEVER
ncbi:MAG TPA: zinc ribbon domain-containing protein, partial [Pseudonocardia sp.]